MDSPLPVLVSLFAPHPRTVALSLAPSTPLAALAPLLARYCPEHDQRLSYSTGHALPPSPAAPIASLRGARPDEGRFVALRLAVRVRGGKGGFASQLRAQGGRMSSNKAQNTDSCRGLDGRRLSTMKEAQRLATLLEAEPDRLAAAAQAKQKKLEELQAEIKRLEQQAGIEQPVASTSSAAASGASAGAEERAEGKQAGGSGAGVKRRLEDSKYVEESKEIVSGVKDAVRAAMLKKRKKAKTAAADAKDEPAGQPASSPSEGEKEKENANADAKGKGKGKGKAAEPEAEEAAETVV
ncbi:hypothetical protein Rhopal_007262-T1 [Rhodotorula paludigena]|uniref:Sde2 N-terminal ubiquitin domain-containing protein n=1 Tax=Rhodotorula paludigena TaxID=86838 RepID=A0AAV5GVD4_9BASI|nr:hypothetical protein Rhopal_007262-T1 [Rhodotorula paludigena]